jgi:hypothetical protein
VNCFISAVITCTAQGASSYYNTHVTEGSGTMRSGLALIKASLILQLFQNVVFVGILVPSLFRRQQQQQQLILYFCFCFLIALILERNIFRMVQIFRLPRSRLWTEEVYFWVFEASVMVAYTSILHIIRPAYYLGNLGCAGDDSDDGCDARRRCG